MSAQTVLKPGDFVKVAYNPRPYAGRTGLLVSVDGSAGGVRFSAKRVLAFELRDLKRMVGRVR